MFTDQICRKLSLTRKDIHIINLFPRESLSYISSIIFGGKLLPLSRNICNEFVNRK